MSRLLLLSAMSACGPAVPSGFSQPDGGKPAPMYPSWAERIRAVNTARAQDGGWRGCAAALPDVTVSSSRGRAEVLEFIALVTSIDAAKFVADPTPCGEPGFAGCSARFQNHMHHVEPPIGDALLTLAREAERDAPPIDLVIWTPTQNGLAGPIEISFAGSREGRLHGFVYFSQRADCPP